MTQRTDVHGPASTAPTTTDQYAVCAVCKCQWQIKGDADKKGCRFCDADESAVSVKYEGA